ncbi:hypothetical protein LENED_001287 [Lentinula edodes]|uniref:Uncharacterized protein n=1 Tax=Lentinula edodes TaxID=5353 RepID=A0A1Q3DXS7_LENED|nr:hypothetical protein LENED_001287 [Lentinula edodes]
MAIRTDDVLIIICAILLPPVAVFLMKRPKGLVLTCALFMYFAGTWCSWLSHPLSIIRLCGGCWVQFPIYVCSRAAND